MFNKLKSTICLPSHHVGKNAQEFLATVNKIVRVSLVETNAGELRCEVEDDAGSVTHLECGVKAVGIWMRLKAEKENQELPQYLLVNE